MKRIYLDYEFKCYPYDLGTITPISVETDFFDGKCDGFIMGYRFVPEGESWTDDYGNVFRGEMIATWIPSDVLEKIQREFERADAETALAILLGGAV